MGVMECNRTGCNNIMCDTYVDGIGYICGECQEEFKTYASSATISGTYDIVFLLHGFLHTKKESYLNRNNQFITEFFKSCVN